MINPGQQLTRT